MDEFEGLKKMLEEHTEEYFQEYFHETKKSFERKYKLMINRSVREELQAGYHTPEQIARICCVPVDYVYSVIEYQRKKHERFMRKIREAYEKTNN